MPNTTAAGCPDGFTAGKSASPALTLTLTLTRWSPGSPPERLNHAKTTRESNSQQATKSSYLTNVFFSCTFKYVIPQRDSEVA